jgi:uncharacterized protein involved in type VI secretion and phage assembly
MSNNLATRLNLLESRGPDCFLLEMKVEEDYNGLTSSELLLFDLDKEGRFDDLLGKQLFWSLEDKKDVKRTFGGVVESVEPFSSSDSLCFQHYNINISNP